MVYVARKLILQWRGCNLRLAVFYCRPQDSKLDSGSIPQQVLSLMGQQSNKVQKRRRRINYKKRVKLKSKTTAVKAAAKPAAAKAAAK